MGRSTSIKVQWTVSRRSQRRRAWQKVCTRVSWQTLYAALVEPLYLSFTTGPKLTLASELWDPNNTMLSYFRIQSCKDCIGRQAPSNTMFHVVVYHKRNCKDCIETWAPSNAMRSWQFLHPKCNKIICIYGPHVQLSASKGSR